MTGILFTLICSVFAAFFFLSNDIFKIRGDVFVFWRSAFSFLILLPFIPFMSWDAHYWFPFALIALANVFYGFGDIYLFNATRQYSASAITRVMVCRNIILFCLWPLIYTGYADRLLSSPMIATGCFVLILVSTVALFEMRKTELGMQVILAALPALFFLCVAELVTGFAVRGHISLAFAFPACVVASFTMALISGLVLAWKSAQHQDIELFQKNWHIAGAGTALLFIGLVTTKTVGIAALENPGYFGAMVTIYTLWIYLLHKYWLKRAELADPRLGFVVVACSIGLALLSLQIPK